MRWSRRRESICCTSGAMANLVRSRRPRPPLRERSMRSSHPSSARSGWATWTRSQWLGWGSSSVAGSLQAPSIAAVAGRWRWWAERVERAIGLLLSRRGAWAAAIALVGITLAAQLSRLAETDMAYMLYAAGRVLDGATLYRDVVDMNPPPIFGLNLAIEWVARATGLSDILLYRLGTALAVGGLLLLV